MCGREVISVSLRRFRYRGDDGYAVAECSAGEGDITVVGYLPQVLPGERLTLTGAWTEHPRYGRQFRADGWELASPDDPEAFVALIAGAGVEGVGPELARRLVEHLGPQAPALILEDPDRLLAVPGIGPARRDRIARAVAERYEALETAAELQRLGVPPDLAWRLQARWGTAAVERVRSDPYAALASVPGLPFRTADAVALRAGADPDDPRRLDAALLQAAEQATWDEGHVYIPAGDLIRRALQRLSHEPPGRDADPEALFRRRLEVLADAGQLIIEGEAHIYLPALYEAEVYRATWLPESARHRVVIWGATSAQIGKAPILGAGIGSGRALNEAGAAAAPAVPGTDFHFRPGLHSHNAYLQVWFETGAVGALILLGLGLLVLRSLSAAAADVQPYLAVTFSACALSVATAFAIWAPWFMASLAMAAIFAALGKALPAQHWAARA